MSDAPPAVLERVETIRSNGLDHAVHRFEVGGAAARPTIKLEIPDVSNFLDKL